MSLFSAIQLASNALQANQIGLQVVGQNISNANTPGYSREVVSLTPGTTQQSGALLLGTGVQVQGIVQQIDQYLEGRTRTATSDSASASTQQATYQSLEQMLNALGDSSIGSQMNDFIASVQNVLNQPESTSVRNLAVLQGSTLANSINSIGQQVAQMQSDLDQQVTGTVASANQLIEQVRSLNLQISQLQGSLGPNSQAVGLTDQRDEALDQLSQLVNIQTQPQPSGSVNVFIGGNWVVFEGQSQPLAVTEQTSDGSTISTPVIASTKTPLDLTGGQLAGLVASRDTVLGGFADDLNQFAGTLAYEFNKVYSSGQGTTGYDTLTSTSSVTSANAPLENAGLPFTPVSGSFNVQVYDTQTGQTEITNIPVDLNGLDGSDTTLASLAQSLNQVNGLSASVTPTGQLTLSTTSPNLSFAFGNDTSGILASLGLNTFFTGSTATSLAVNPVLLADPTKFAASQGGIGTDTNNAVQMAGFLTQPLSSLNGQTITDLNNQLTSNVTEASAQASSVASGLSAYQSTLQGQELAASGVSIDEETVNMMSYQRAYQASAKFISTVNQLLDTLMQM